MDNSLVTKINEHTKDKPIFYITNDPERALGLEKILDNFHIVCIDYRDIVDYMVDEGVKVFCLEKELGEVNALYRNSNKLLNHELVQKYIEENGKDGFLMTFKISPSFEKSAEKLGMEVLNTSAELNRKFENKLSQYNSLSEKGINFPSTTISKLSDYDFSEEVVVQFDRGHTGSGTIFINSKEELEELKSKFPDREVRISKKINGDTYTINACITDKGVLASGLSYQITGVEEFTSNEGGTIGNDFFNRTGLDEDGVSKLLAEVEEIGVSMKEAGFMGLFGVDFVVEENIPYVIEVNARQPASVSFFNSVQIEKGETPMQLYHVATFLGIDFEIEQAYTEKNTSPIEAGQVFLRNTQNDPFVVGANIKSGLYRLQSDNSSVDWKKDETKENVIFVDESGDKPLIYKQDAYRPKDSSAFLLLTQPKQKSVNSGNELARIQSMTQVVDSNGKLIPWIKEALITIKNYIK